MDIESILSSLGLDLTNPDTKKGAIEAINAILDSRAPAMSLDGITGGMSGEQDVELDPDLLQPSVKNQPQENSDDVEINDEDDVLKNMKHNDSEDSSDSSISNETEAGDSSDERSSSDEADDNSGSNNSSGSDTAFEDEAEPYNDATDDADMSDTEEVDSSDSAGENTSNAGADAVDDEPADEEGVVADEEASEADAGRSEDETETETDDEADDGIDGESGSETDTDADEGTADEKDELDIDEDDLLDDNIKNAYDDREQNAKHEARKIKRERTLQAAQKALAAAQSAKKSPALIRELEKAIEALESLQEAVAKNLKDLSDEEFNLLVNRVFDAIDALGDSDLTYTSDEERKIKAQEIKADIENRQTQAELSAEDIAQIRAETQAIKAREREKAKYQRKGRGSFKGFQDFLNSLYRAIALQVHTEETRDDSWSAISRRNSGAGVLQQGKKFNELPNRKIPVIDFYFDQSGSWDESDIKVGEKAVAALAEMEEKGQIKINIYYFSNHVHTDAQSARNEGGTWAWNDIVKNIITTQATNVIIMTDSDMEDRWDYDGYWSGKMANAAAYTVPGYVWYLWRGGDNAPRLPRDLKGRGGTQQFSFNSGDV